MFTTKEGKTPGDDMNPLPRFGRTRSILKCIRLGLMPLATTLLCIGQEVSAQSSNRIQILKNGSTVAVISNLAGRLQIRADKSKNIGPNTTRLTGNVMVSATSDNREPVHLRADEVVIESQAIEIQVYYYHHDDQLGWINTLGDTAGEPQAAGEALLKALQAHPDVGSFRMKFGLLLGGAGSESTVLYNRREKTLTYYESGSWDEGRQRYIKHELYDGVSDDILKALVEKYRRTGEGYTHGYFAFLPEFGCKRTKLSG